jgi:hypothetical protein
MPPVTSKSPWIAVSLACRHWLGFTVGGHGPYVTTPNTSMSQITRPSAFLITPGSSRAIRPRSALSKSALPGADAGPRHRRHRACLSARRSSRAT